jgi:hypothetical protein
MKNSAASKEGTNQGGFCHQFYNEIIKYQESNIKKIRNPKYETVIVQLKDTFAEAKYFRLLPSAFGKYKYSKSGFQ